MALHRAQQAQQACRCCRTGRKLPASSKDCSMTSLLAGGLAAGFLKSWGMILVSEIGDKTFFIAAVMAMKNSRQSVSAKASAALLMYGVKAHSTKLHPSLAYPFVLHCTGVWRCSWCTGSYDSSVSTDGMGRTHLGQSICAFPVLLTAAGISTSCQFLPFLCY